MNIYRPTQQWAILLTALQLLGPTALWAADTQRGVRVQRTERGIVTGLRGQVAAIDVAAEQNPRPLNFRDLVDDQDRITTDIGASAEVLVGDRTLVTLSERSGIRITQDQSAQTVIEISNGTVRVATAPREQPITLRTPTVKAITHGGLIHVTVQTPMAQATPASFQPTATRLSFMAATGAQIETFYVREGKTEIVSVAPGGAVMLQPVQSVQVIDGRLGQVMTIAEADELQSALPAVQPHANTPRLGMEHLLARQIAQAGALERALLGTGETAATQQENYTVILPTTALTLTASAGSSGGSGGAVVFDPGTRNPFGPPSETGSAGTAVIDPTNNSGLTLEITGSVGTASNITTSVPGGAGLLLFRNSQVSLDHALDNGNVSLGGDALMGIPPRQDLLVNTELLLIDGGATANAPHMGKAPSERLIVNELKGFTGFIPSGGPGRNTLLSVSSDRISLTPAANLFTRGTTPAEAYSILAQYASSPAVDPAVPLGSLPPLGLGTIFFGAPLSFVQADLSQSAQTEGVDGVIRARSGVGAPVLILKGGVVLDNASVTATNTQATSLFFADVDGSIAAVLGRNLDIVRHFEEKPKTFGPGTEPRLVSVTIEGGALNPANVKFEDRVLAVMNGSSIMPDPTTTPNVALLTILDSVVTGPSAPPDLLSGDTPPSGSVPSGKARADVPALIEVIGGSATTSTTTSHHAILLRAELDQALLAASAPLVTMIKGSMTTVSDFMRVDGANAKLMATIPNDQLVLQALVQVINSTATIGGHLLSVTGGANGSITGNLLAIAAGGTVNLAGALVNVGAGSIFSLAGGSLVAFGTGTNTLNITSLAGACGGCNLSTTLPNLAGVPVLSHPTAAINVTAGFLPYAGLAGTLNTVNVTSGAAVLQVGAGGSVTLSPN